MKIFIVFFAFCSLSLFAEEGPSNDVKKEIPADEMIVTSHVAKIGDEDLSYRATVGTQLLSDAKGKAKASIFYVAYTKESELKSRPITFCFNGGPGSSAVWLHLGAFGPRRIEMDEEGKSVRQPYHLVDNLHSLLDITDLVFIDPISTGYSRVLAGEDDKQFHSVEADIQSVAEFIRLYITRNERWESPKFLAGESYGTTRAVGLAQELNDTHHLSINGIVLISCVLNFQTISFDFGNDLPYILFLPTYSATALYHQRLASHLQKNPLKTLKEVEAFAYGDYAQALLIGDYLPDAQRRSVLDRLSLYTGLPREYIEDANLRVNIYRFAKELLRQERRTVGRFDSRLKGINTDLCTDLFEFDPSFEGISGPFTATFNHYVSQELNWKNDMEYKILANVWPWDFGSSNQYLDVGEKLKSVMSKNPELGVFVASGYNDLATPFLAAEYTMGHLGLDPCLQKNIFLKVYEGGHMMYLNYPSLIQLKKDLVHFYGETLRSRK